MNKFGKALLAYSVPIGIYRGIIHSNDYTIDQKLYTEKVTTYVINITGSIAFNTFVFPLSLYRNAKRLEVNLRGLEDEKKKIWYRDII